MNQIIYQAKASPHWELLRHSYYRLLKTQLTELLGTDEDAWPLRWRRTLRELQPIIPFEPVHEESECRKSDWVKFYVDALNSEYIAIGELPDITQCESLTPVACEFPLIGTIDDGVTSSST